VSLVAVWLTKQLGSRKTAKFIVVMLVPMVILTVQAVGMMDVIVTNSIKSE
jgi:hypothetical protein